jgi:hypothetical protein
MSWINIQAQDSGSPEFLRNLKRGAAAAGWIEHFSVLINDHLKEVRKHFERFL